MTKTVLFVAPLPPPVSGYSLASKRMLDALSKRLAVRIIDRRPIGHGILGMLGDGAKFAFQLLTLPVLLSSKPVFYVAVSGGGRQILDCTMVLLARIFGAKLFFHHHSFAYLNHPNRLSRFLFRAGKGAHHLALGPKMAHLIAEQYGIAAGNISILSNAAFIEPATEVIPPPPESIRLGYLSNITAEKGIIEFFSLWDACRAARIAISATIAGPVDGAVKEAFFAALEARPEIVYLGPVDGEAKNQFFAAIDVFVFPTKYVNEAEPMVLLEAAAHGAALLSTNRGCIADLVRSLDGAVVSSGEQFSEEGLAVLTQWSSQRCGRADVRSAAASRYVKWRGDAVANLDGIIAMMLG